MVTFIFFVIGLCFLASAGWLLRINRWPRVQVRVMRRWEEITGRDDDGDIGWQHADIEYWYESKKYAVRWKCDLQEQKLMASAVWMVLNPNQPEAPQLPAGWHMAAVFIFMVLVAFSGVVWNVIN